MYSVAFSGNLFVAVGSGGTIITSPDEIENAVKPPSPLKPTILFAPRVRVDLSGNRLIANVAGFPQSRNISFRIVNISGKVLKTFQGATTSVYYLPVDNLASGMYFLQVQAEDSKATCPFVIGK